MRCGAGAGCSAMKHQSFVDQVLRHYAFHLTLVDEETVLDEWYWLEAW